MSKGQAEIINDLIQKISGSIRVGMPAIIESYDFKTQKADIKIDMQELYQNETSLDYPVLSGVPVLFPRCGGASITMPIVRGDTCLVMFLDRDSTAWLLGGKNTKPKSRRMHHLSDAVAIMGLSPFTNASEATNNTDLLITYDGSQLVLKPKGSIDIHLAKEVNIKTEGVIINCKNANIKAEESIIAECKSATITSLEDTSINCKNAQIKANENVAVECKSSQVKASEGVSIECKNAQVKSSENTSVECKNANIKSLETTNIECKSANIKASEDVSVDCKAAVIKASDNSTIECKSAIIKASSTINTETPNFTQKGNMKIEGNVEVTGNVDSTSTITGNAIKTSSGKDLATHTHSYTSR